MTPEKAFKKAVKIAGGQTAMARICSTPEREVTQGYIWWCLNESKKRHCPVELVLVVERETGVSRHDLRPDIYGEKPAEPKGAAA
ncbi:MAG: YdaS family helix-turn-helix protein [Rhodospirillales bacterium]